MLPARGTVRRLLIPCDPSAVCSSVQDLDEVLELRTVRSRRLRRSTMRFAAPPRPIYTRMVEMGSPNRSQAALAQAGHPLALGGLRVERVPFRLELGLVGALLLLVLRQLLGRVDIPERRIVGHRLVETGKLEAEALAQDR